jgi:hypothetical protein
MASIAPSLRNEACSSEVCSRPAWNTIASVRGSNDGEYGGRPVVAVLSTRRTAG